MENVVNTAVDAAVNNIVDAVFEESPTVTVTTDTLKRTLFAVTFKLLRNKQDIGTIACLGLASNMNEASAYAEAPARAKLKAAGAPEDVTLLAVRVETLSPEGLDFY